MNRRVFVSLAVVLLVAGLSVRTAAATDIAGGYSFSRITDEPAQNFPGGWFATVGLPLTPMFDIVADFSGAYTSESTTFFDVPVDESFKLHSYTFGPRGWWRQPMSPVSVYGQVLFGALTQSVSQTSTVSGVDFTASDSQTDFAIQPGGGVDVKLNDRWSVRGGLNFRLVHFEDSWGKVLQVIAGAVYHMK